MCFTFSTSTLPHSGGKYCFAQLYIFYNLNYDSYFVDYVYTTGDDFIRCDALLEMKLSKHVESSV